MVLQQFTEKQVFAMLDEDDTEVRTWADSVLPTLNKWLARGDGIAVYENHDLGHPMIGHKQFISFGSDVCQLDRPEWNEVPPQTLPDIGGAINWRYQLIGVYRGARLERKVEGG